MIFSHFLKYCHRCLPSWITSYRIITIENNFFLLKIISVCIGPGFTIWAYKKYWHFWSSGSKVDLKDTNHIFIWLVILTISTFRRVWLFVLTNFMFLLQRWCIEKKVGMWIVSVIIKMVYKRMNPDTRWYKGEEKYSRSVFMWWTFNMKTQVIIMQQLEYFYCIYLIRYFDYHRNKASIEQIYNITAYTDI